MLEQELNQKLVQLQKIYETTVEEISRERSLIAYNSRKHKQMLATHTMVRSLQTLLDSQKHF